MGVFPVFWNPSSNQKKRLSRWQGLGTRTVAIPKGPCKQRWQPKKNGTNGRGNDENHGNYGLHVVTFEY